ncbi:MAG: hypothetical protein MI922_09060, partial [Bacteroidales bacterium]|nr:hypothetical protein [Bacteroidales bacterium]
AEALPKLYLFEIVVEGKISVFKRFAKVGGVQMVSGAEAAAVMEEKEELTFEQKVEAANHKFEILILKEDSKMAKSITNVVIDKYINDKSEVLEKYKNGDYGSINNILSSPLKPASFNANHPKYAEGFIDMITEYNK